MRRKLPAVPVVPPPCREDERAKAEVDVMAVRLALGEGWTADELHRAGAEAAEALDNVCECPSAGQCALIGRTGSLSGP